MSAQQSPRIARPRIGDVFEIDTDRGYAYALYAHLHPELGFHLRLFRGFYATPQTALEQIVAGPEQFTAFVRLLDSLQAGTARSVGHLAVPECLRSFPLFKRGFPGPDRKWGDRWML